MIKYLITICLIIVAEIVGFSQSNAEILNGEVTFITGSNVYVRFDNTAKINIGDSLYLDNDRGIACLEVVQKSSSSCVTKKIGDCQIKQKDQIVFKLKETAVIKDLEEVELIEPQEEEKETDEVPYLEQSENIKEYAQRIRARASASTYSNFSSIGEDRHRFMARFSFRGDHLDDSKFSLESNLNYRQNFSSENFPADYKTKFFRVYNMALSYDVDSTMRISLGRKINRKISSVGAIDGLQLEKSFGKFYSGAIVGFRPAISDFGFNPDLFEYGLFLGLQTNNNKTNSESTIGFLEQRNTGAIDRRYTYLQHRSNITRNLNLFASAELDLFSRLNNIGTTDPRLTNLYVSARYRMNRKLSFTLSFDSRKRIIYYETLRTEVERLLADDQASQGIRLRLNFKPLKYVNGSISFSNRKQTDGTNNSDNININLSHSRVPVIGGRLSLTANMNESDYLRSRIISLRHNRSVFSNKLDLSLYYRLVNYTYLSSEIQLNQYYYGANFSFKISREFAFSFLAELSSTEKEKKYRFNTKLIRRFGR